MKNYGHLGGGECRKNCQEEQRICKSCLMISLRFEEISLHHRNGDIFHKFFQDYG